MPVALFFRPNTNTALSFGKAWLSDGIAEAESRGYDIIDIMDQECTFDNLKSALENYDVDVAFLLGHGSNTHFTGRTVDGRQEVVFYVCHGDEVLSDTISHFVSCTVGQELLPDVIEKGAIYTLGYADTFDFIIQPEEAVEPFRDINVAVITSILDGATVKEAWDAGVAKGEEWLDRLHDNPESWASDAITMIRHDINCMVGLGDEGAYVMPPSTVRAGVPTGKLLVLGGLAWVML